jgi:Kelch motif
MRTARGVHAAALLNDGTVLVSCGRIATRPQASAERFDPNTNSWSPAGQLSTPRSDQTTTVLQDGRVLVAGGLAGERVLASARLFDPGANSWSETGSLVTAREDHTATLLPDGRVLVVGGDADDDQTPLASAEQLCPVRWAVSRWPSRVAPGLTQASLGRGSFFCDGFSRVTWL